METASAPTNPNAHEAPAANRKEPIRVFKSDFMEFFTHISPVAVLVVWVPIIALSGVIAWFWGPQSGIPWQLVLGIPAGLAFWTLTEYCLHRFLFHYHPKSEVGKRINFMFHGIHHAQPMVKTRLVMPPIVSLPLGAIFFGLFWLVFAVIFPLSPWVWGLFTGTSLGYVLYDMTHYATHHFNFKAGWFHWIRSHHMKHHVQTPDARFGVTSPLWDHVIRTEPAPAPTPPPKAAS